MKKKAIGLYPVGNRILAKIIERKETSTGLEIPQGIEPEFCTWAEIIALPEHRLNPFINKFKVGDKVAYLHFAKDMITHPDTGERFIVLEVERDGGIKGQIAVHLPQERENHGE